MGCTGDREKGPPEHTQKWEFITLSDFKATSGWAGMGYGWLWLMAIVSIAVYALDTFTAVNLLIFDKWSSQIKPTVPFEYSKWIFAVCILLSWALCLYEWMRAIRVIKRGGVAESYMDPLAVSLQSMRSQGWKRFLVFTELTKSKKGADYVAFFVYFAFDGAIRVILAEAPRQAVNAITLYAVMKADLLVKGSEHHGGFEQFWLNLQALADKNTEQALILFSMLFTLVIWVFSALSLAVATILYLVFLWHYIPQRDGRLSIYCRRKIDRRLEKVVEHKVKAAFEEEERKKQKAEKKADLKRQKTGELLAEQKPTLGRQPTLPQLGESPELKQDNKSDDFGLVRQNTSTTVSTLPLYESRPPTRNGSQMQRQPTMQSMHSQRPPMPSRMGTQGSQGSGWSNTSYESNAPLLSNAGYAGEDRAASPAPAMPPQAFSRQESNASFGRPSPARTMTQGSQATQRSYTPMSRMDTSGSQQRPFSPMSNNGSVYSRAPPGARGPPVRSNTGFSFDDQSRSAISPISPQDSYGRPAVPISRQNTQDTFATAPLSRLDNQASSFSRPMPSMDRRPTFGSMQSQQSFSRPMALKPRDPSESSFERSLSPAADQQLPLQHDSYEMTPQPSYANLTNAAPTQHADGEYVAFNPSLLSASSAPTPTPQQQPQQGPRRNITVAGQAGASGNYFGQVREVPQRSATAPIDPRHTTGYADIFDEYGDSARSSIAPPEATRGFQQSSRPQMPSGLQRAHTAEPADGEWDFTQNRF